jgi:arginase
VDVDLLLVPYDSAWRGARMGAGPEHLAATGLAEELGRSGHAVRSTPVESASDWRAEIRTAFELMGRLAGAVRASCAAGRFPLVLAGNCNTAVGTVAGLGLGAATAVLWFDAHGDFNTPETTVGGFLDGMALAILTGRCWRELARRVPGFTPVAESAVCLLGARDLDPLEADLLADSAVRVLGPGELASGLGAALAALAARAEGAYVHVDLDVLDPGEGRANEFAAPGGLGAAALTGAIGAIGEALPIRGAAITAYDPRSDGEGRVRAVAGRVAAALLAAAERPRRS